jgi:hypothetical protein
LDQLEQFLAKLEHNQHTWIQYHIIGSGRNYYNLGSFICYAKEVWSQNYASGDKQEFVEVISINVQNILYALEDYASGDKQVFVEAISLNVQNILYALEENAIHRRSKNKDLST